MSTQLMIAALAFGLVMGFDIGHATAQKGDEVRAVDSWKGRISEEQMKLAPKGGYIASAETFKKLWKDWKLAGDAPKVDFEKHLIVFAMLNSSGPVLTTRLDKKSGDLIRHVVSDSDLTQDYGYHIVVIPRAGIKTIDGKGMEKQK